MTQPLKVVGLDPSLRNWGIAIGTLDVGSGQVQIGRLDVVQPVLPTGKQVRQNSCDLEAALQLSKGAMAAVQGAQAIFVEVPVGSQSARAMASYGVCIGVLGALRATGIPFFEITPTEVKMVSVGSKTATKEQMIAWAMQQHPEAPWPMQTKKGVTSVVAGSAEHMADAVAAIHAGITSNPFKQMLSMMNVIRAA